MQATDASSNLLRAESELILAQARQVKAARTKNLGSPIQLSSTPLAILVREGYAWVGDNTTVTRKIELETGKTLQIYRGHTGPVSALTFAYDYPGPGGRKVLITGSWDKTICLWNTTTKEKISSTPAHDDFVKCLLAFPKLNLLVSGGSDKTVRFWDLSKINGSEPMAAMGSISSHTRPIECLEGRALSDDTVMLYTADTMGVIKVWDLRKDNGPEPRWTPTLNKQIDCHRTRINEMVLGNFQGELWTASADDTVQITPQYPPDTPSPPPITHPTAVRAILPLSLTYPMEPYLITGAGDVIRTYDLSSPSEPELISEIDAHWHDVTALRLWVRRWKVEHRLTLEEPWVVSASLDGTIRKWKLNELLHPPPAESPSQPKPVPSEEEDKTFELTQEEEAELAELMD